MAIPFLRSQATKVYSALPSSPDDGQELRYLADTTNGIVWHLRYRAGSPSAFKWEYIGGPPVTGYSEPAVALASGTTFGISAVNPLAGDYVLTYGCSIIMSNAATFRVQPYNGSAYTGTNTGIEFTFPAGGQQSASLTRLLPNQAAGQSWKMVVNNGFTGSGSAYDNFTTLIPIRVG